MWLATHPTSLHPSDVVTALGRLPESARLVKLREAVADDAGADWERDLLDALAEPRPEARAALVNEQLTELDRRMQRWARVPRVAARIASSLGIMLGMLVLRNGLASAPDLSGELGELFVRDVMGDAILVASLGIVGMSFCIAAHSRSRQMTRAWLESADRMVEILESAASGNGSSAQRETPDEGGGNVRQRRDAHPSVPHRRTTHHDGDSVDVSRNEVCFQEDS